MIPVYKCLWRDDDQPKRKVANALCSWSARNYVAYTTGHHCDDPSRDVNTVYIMSPDTPWEHYPIKTQHRAVIQHIAWNDTGDLLLTVDQVGMGKIWCQDEFVINKWKSRDQMPIHFIQDGRIIKIAWLSTCINQLQLDYDKIGEKDWYQRFALNRADILSSMSEENKDVFIMVTFDGLFKVMLRKPNGKLITYTSQLGTLKSNVLSADFLVIDSNKIFVAAVTEPCMVELFTVHFKDDPGNAGVEISVEAWPCIVPYTVGEPNFEEYVIEDVMCIKKCNPSLSSDQVLVRCKNSTTSSVKVYEIKKEQVQLHPRLISQNQPGQQADTCSCLATYQFPNANLEYMIATKCHFTNIGNINDASIVPKLVLFDHSGTIHVYSLVTFQHIATTNTIREIKLDMIETCVFSPGDNALFGVTKAGNLALLTFPCWTTQDKAARIRHTVVLLQSYLATARDPWDLMLHLSVYDKHFIEQCLQQFSSEFTDVDIGIQSLLYENLFHTKALFHAINKDYKGEFENYSMSLLHHLYNYFISTLQSEKEISLVEKIHNICVASKKEFDLNKVLSFLDTKDITFNHLTNTIHRPMIQWVTDYMVHFVRLILSTSHHHNDWKTIFQYFESNSLLLLRKICVLFYIMQKVNLNIHPIYVTMVNSFEVLPQLFKMLSKMHAVALGDSASGDNIFTDLPFSSLPMMYLEYPSEHPRGSVLSQSTLIHTTSSKNPDFSFYDIQLTLDDWSLIHDTAVSNPLTLGIQAVNTQQRQIYDGINFAPASLIVGEKVKQCCRCGLLTIYNHHQTRFINELWASCWAEQCVCGGRWKKVDEK